MSDIYPKATAPITADVLQAANDRADRWLKRWEEAVRQRDEAEAKLEAARNALAACREVRETRQTRHIETLSEQNARVQREMQERR